MNRITEGAKEALAVARGEQPAAAIWHQGFRYVPETEIEKAVAAEREACAEIAEIYDGGVAMEIRSRRGRVVPFVVTDEQKVAIDKLMSSPQKFLNAQMAAAMEVIRRQPDEK